MKTFGQFVLVLALWLLGGYTGFYIAARDGVDTLALALIVTWIASAALVIYTIGLRDYLRRRRSADPDG